MESKLMHQQILKDKYMLSQFKNALIAVANRMESKTTDADTVTRLKTRLSEDLSWAETNEIELAMIDLLDDISLQTEWQRQLAELHTLPTHLQAHYAKATEMTDPVEIRPLLTRLITDLQWQRESDRVIRFNETRMRTNIVWLFLFSFVLFFTPTIFRILFSIEFDNLRLYYLFTAATSGILGAAFSQLTSVQSRVQAATVEQVKAMSKLGYILARSMVGAGAGLIMFYLLQSGLLSGAFFPKFIQSAEELSDIQSVYSVLVADNAGSISSLNIEEPVGNQGVSQSIETNYDIGTLARPPQGLSLLIIWCLLAGFSEKLIPGILNNKAKKLTTASA